LSTLDNPSASTGVSDIDRFLGGGVPRGTLVIVEESGSERSNFPSYFLSMKFLKEGLLNGERGIVLLTEHSVQEYLEAGTLTTIDLASHRDSGELTVIDAFSGYAGLMSQSLETSADIVVESPTNTTKLFDILRNLLTVLVEGGYRNKVRLIVDTVSTLVAAAGFQKVWNLWLGLEPVHRTTGCITMGMLYPGMHSPQETESFERLADGVVEFRGYEPTEERIEGDFLQIKKMRRSTFLRERVPYLRSGWEIVFHQRNQLTRKY
jgi:KaiC/GvpD/RAD55 family RecA-like ATPase